MELYSSDQLYNKHGKLIRLLETKGNQRAANARLEALGRRKLEVTNELVDKQVIYDHQITNDISYHIQNHKIVVPVIKLKTALMLNANVMALQKAPLELAHYQFLPRE